MWISKDFLSIYCLGHCKRLNEYCVYHETRRGYHSKVWGRYWGWVLVGPREEISMGKRVKEKNQEKRNQLQNSLRKWNSKKLRAIVQHCGFLSKYDSPCARREKIGGLQRTRVQFLMKNDVPMKVILRNTLSGKGEVQMPKCRDYWGWRDRGVEWLAPF